MLKRVRPFIVRSWTRNAADKPPLEKPSTKRLKKLSPGAIRINASSDCFFRALCGPRDNSTEDVESLCELWVEIQKEEIRPLIASIANRETKTVRGRGRSCGRAALTRRAGCRATGLPA